MVKRYDLNIELIRQQMQPMALQPDAAKPNHLGSNCKQLNKMMICSSPAVAGSWPCCARSEWIFVMM